MGDPALIRGATLGPLELFQEAELGTCIAKVRNRGEHKAQTNFWRVQIKVGQGN